MTTDTRLTFRKLIQKFPSVKFIQIGSNDGISNDLLREYILMDKSWTGLLIEPIPFLFESLKKNYENKELTFLNVAVGNTNSEQTIYKIDEKYKDILPLGCFELASFKKEIILKHRAFFNGLEEYMIVPFKVQVRTFDSLVEEYHLEELDLVQIDTEGFDFEIIKSIKFKKHKPKIIVYENAHLTDKDYSDCITLLKNNGYSIVSGLTDTIAYLK